MNNFIFENKTKVYFGKGGVKEYLGCLLKQYGPTVMLAYGGGSIKKNGVYDEVTGILNAQGKKVIEFSGIMPNPTYKKAQEGAKLARENHVDLILAVGGGSVSDCCKIVSAQAKLDEDIWDMEMVKHTFPSQFIPLGTIVPVFGTGSEMNAGAVIGHGGKRRAKNRKGHGFSGAPDRASAGRVHQLQPRQGAGGDSSCAVPAHLRRKSGAFCPLCRKCLGHSGQRHGFPAHGAAGEGGHRSAGGVHQRDRSADHLC